MVIQQRELTLEAFLKRPERKPALEFMHGKVRQKGAPKARHSVLQAGLDRGAIQSVCGAIPNWPSRSPSFGPPSPERRWCPTSR